MPTILGKPDNLAEKDHALGGRGAVAVATGWDVLEFELRHRRLPRLGAAFAFAFAAQTLGIGLDIHDREQTALEPGRLFPSGEDQRHGVREQLPRLDELGHFGWYGAAGDQPVLEIAGETDHPLRHPVVIDPADGQRQGAVSGREDKVGHGQNLSRPPPVDANRALSTIRRCQTPPCPSARL